MKVGIMQPYILPYIGYYQLINAVDAFIIYDDVNYIKQGWINRNRILLNGNEFMFNLKIKSASSFKKINELEIVSNNQKLLSTLSQAYCKAPFYKEVFPLITDILSYNETNLAKYLINSLRITLEYLGINTLLYISSEIKNNKLLKGDNKVIDICKLFNATEYINAIGGQDLYSSEKFAEHNLTLSFIRSKLIIYPQFKNQFVPWLSIIDVMMFNSLYDVRSLLNQYELV